MRTVKNQPQCDWCGVSFKRELAHRKLIKYMEVVCCSEDCLNAFLRYLKQPRKKTYKSPKKGGKRSKFENPKLDTTRKTLTKKVKLSCYYVI